MASYSLVSVTTTNGSGSGLTVNLDISWDYYYNWNASWRIVDKGDDFKVGDTITIPRPVAGLPDPKIFPNQISNYELLIQLSFKFNSK